MEMTRLDHVATVQARIGWKALTADEYVDDGYVLLATPNIKRRDIDFDDVNYITEFRYQESPELKLRLGDVLLAKDGSTLGIANCVRSLPRPATVNGSVAVLRVERGDPRFLMYWIQGAPLQGQIQQVKDGMGVPHLFQRDIRKFPVPNLADLEQRRIADFLDDRVSRIDRIIAARRSQIESALIAQSSVMTEVSTPPENDVGWSLLKFSRVAQLNDGLVDPKAAEYRAMPLIAPNHIEKKTGRLLALESAEEQGAESGKGLVAAGQIIYSKIRPSLRKVTIAPCNCLCSADAYGMAPVQGVVTSEYLHAVLLGDYFSQQVIDASERVAMPKVNRDSLAEVRVWVPSIGEQEARARGGHERSREFERFVAIANQSMERLGEYKSSLITAAVTGELDVATAGSNIPG